jgi:phage shock protein PspC (stress-responsive transcriptional regulator)
VISDWEQIIPMKKTISINIAGIVFHIEDDGYEKLNAYLKAIQKYFSSYEGSKEIVEDIEARIAEKFWDKQKSDDKQAISLHDVEGLITSMGSVSDFAAIEEDEDLAMAGEKNQTKQTFTEESQKEETSNSSYQSKSQTGKSDSEYNYKYEYSYKYNYTNKKLFRDTKRKLLGGVCAGLAYNLGFDPLWVRLAFLFLLIGIGPITAGILSAITFIFYIACWIAFPANPALEEDDRIRKFYRNPDGKVLGGVMSGIASYTGWDLGMLRFVSVLSIFLFGSGIIIYVILWAIAPEAKTLTDKMQMSGEPITLENIESNIKRTFNVENHPENSLTKILLLPFRVISQVFKALGPFAEFLVTAGKVFVGGLMFFIGVVTIIALVFSLFVGVTALEAGHVYLGNSVPIGLIGRDASPLMIIGGFLASAVPAFVIAWAGLSLVIRRNLFTPTVWQSALGVFVVGLFVTMYTGVRYARNFAKTASIEKVLNYEVGNKTPAFDLNYTGFDQNWEPSVELIGYDGTTIKVEQIFKADGRDKQDAEKNAVDVNYNIFQKDTILTFDDRLDFNDNARFRDQHIRMKVYVPYDKEFTMSRGFAQWIDNSLDRQSWDDKEGDKFKGSRWKFTKDGELVCTNRILKSKDENNESDNNAKTLELKDFEYIKSEVNSGVCNYEIRQGNEFKVEVEGTYNKDDLKYEVTNNALYIKNRNNNSMTVKITMPKLKGIILKGGNGESNIYDFSGEKLEIELSDQNRLIIGGSVKELLVKNSGSSQLQAFDLQTNNIIIEAKDNASAEVNVKDKFEATSKGSANIRYRGEPSVNRSVREGGAIEKE